MITLTKSQKEAFLKVLSDGIKEAYKHICFLGSEPKGTRLYCRGMFISLRMATRRRKRCIKLYKETMSNKI